MTRGLRYPSLDAMPVGMRERLQGAELRRHAAKMVARHAEIMAPRARRDDEHTEQVVFFNRIRALGENRRGCWALAARRTFAIPNGGGRSKREAGRLKAEGVTKGVSDVMCALPRGPYAGLFIEMKSRVGQASPEQRAWNDESNANGYMAVVCRGADEATTLWCAYVAMQSTGRA